MKKRRSVWWGISQSSLFILEGTRHFSNLIFILYAAFALFVNDRWPWLVGVLSVVMIGGGIPLFLCGSRKMGEYKGVYDYEPTQFWDKERNGKEVRELLMALNTIGVWSVLTGTVTGMVLLLRVMR